MIDQRQKRQVMEDIFENILESDMAPSKKVGCRMMTLAFDFLSKQDAPIRSASITEHIRNTAVLTAHELVRFEKTGYIRWESLLHFYSIDYVKAGFITKEKAGWSSTEKGRQFRQANGPIAMFKQAGVLYREWKKGQTSKKGSGARVRVEQIAGMVDRARQGSALLGSVQRAGGNQHWLGCR